MTPTGIVTGRATPVGYGAGAPAPVALTFYPVVHSTATGDRREFLSPIAARLGADGAIAPVALPAGDWDAIARLDGEEIGRKRITVSAGSTLTLAPFAYGAAELPARLSEDGIARTIGEVAVSRLSPTVEAAEDVPAMLGRRALRLLSRDASGTLSALQRTVVDVITNQGNGYTALNLYPTLAESRIKLSFWMDPTEVGSVRERPLSIETHGNTENGEYDVSFYTQGPEGYSTSRKAFQWHWGPKWDGLLEFDMALFVKATDVNPNNLNGSGAYVGMFPTGVDVGQPWIVLHHGAANRPWMLDNRSGTLRLRTRDTAAGSTYTSVLELVGKRITAAAGVNLTTGGATNAGSGEGVLAIRNASVVPSVTVNDTVMVYAEGGSLKARSGNGSIATLVPNGSRPQYAVSGLTELYALDVAGADLATLRRIVGTLIRDLTVGGGTHIRSTVT